MICVFMLGDDTQGEKTCVAAKPLSRNRIFL